MLGRQAMGRWQVVGIDDVGDNMEKGKGHENV